MKKIFFLIFPILLLSACTVKDKIAPTPSSETSTVTSSDSTNIVKTPISSKPSRTIPTPSLGSGTTKVEMFIDYQCEACQAFSKSLWPVFEKYARDGKLTIEYRQFPLNMHKNAYRNAIAALCSAEQGKYMEAKDALYAQEIAKKDAPVSDTERIATLMAVGVEKSSLESCLGGNIFQTQVDDDLAYGEQMNVNGTPSIFLDGKKLDLGAVRDPVSLAKFLDQYTTK